ncbi:putative copper homeostasis (lipo)protein LpqS [Nocardia cyriacigeorgica]
MNISARLRRASAGLLMAVLLVAPLIDCTLHGQDEHTHPATGALVEVATGSHTHSPHSMSGGLIDHCDQHMIHCVEKSLLPSSGATVSPLLWLALLATTTVAALALIFTGARGIRGPPAAALPVSNGQDILTNFCISRR